jgi:quinol monooxygenase YgiN
MVIDVWSDEDALAAFAKNEDFQHVLREAGLPEPQLRTYPVHNMGWPVDEVPMYR